MKKLIRKNQHPAKGSLEVKQPLKQDEYNGADFWLDLLTPRGVYTAGKEFINNPSFGNGLNLAVQGASWIPAFKAGRLAYSGGKAALAGAAHGMSPLLNNIATWLALRMPAGLSGLLFDTDKSNYVESLDKKQKNPNK